MQSTNYVITLYYNYLYLLDQQLLHIVVYYMFHQFFVYNEMHLYAAHMT